MKLLITAWLFCFTLPVFAQTKCDSIAWKADRRLTWKDYKASTPGRQTIAAAYTHFDLTRTWSVDGTILKTAIVCSFNPCLSWSKNKKSDTLLLHEQGHFDIGEYFRRLYFKRVAEASFTPTNLQEMMAKIYRDVNLECEAMQTAYDIETVHSLNRKAQFEWLDKIATLLASVEAYNKNELMIDLNKP